MKRKLQEEIDKSHSYEDKKYVEMSQYEELQNEFSQYKQEADLEETKLINELDETKSHLIKEQKKLTSSQANVAELMKQLNDLRQAKGSYMYHCSDCPLLMEWVESLLSCLLSYLSKHPMDFLDPPSALPQNIYNWAEDQISTAQNIGTSLQSFRASMLEKSQLEQQLLDALKPLFVNLNIIESEDDISMGSLFEHIESAKSAIESFTSTYHTIINKKAETATDEMKNTIKSLEEEKNELLKQLKSNKDEYERNINAMNVRLHNYEQQITELNKKLNSYQLYEDESNQMNEHFNEERKNYERQIQVLKNTVEEKELLVNQQKDIIENMAGEKLSLQRRYDTIVENMKESSNDSYFFGSSTNLKRLNEQKSNETNMNVLLEIEKQKIEEEANAKYIFYF